MIAATASLKLLVGGLRLFSRSASLICYCVAEAEDRRDGRYLARWWLDGSSCSAGEGHPEAADLVRLDRHTALDKPTDIVGIRLLPKDEGAW